MAAPKQAPCVSGRWSWLHAYCSLPGCPSPKPAADTGSRRPPPILQELDALPDPCPLPGTTSKRRSLSGREAAAACACTVTQQWLLALLRLCSAHASKPLPVRAPSAERDRLLYAPMADVGGFLWDKDAVYIDIPDWKVTARCTCVAARLPFPALPCPALSAWWAEDCSCAMLVCVQAASAFTDSVPLRRLPCAGAVQWSGQGRNRGRDHGRCAGQLCHTRG
jgi:hypothetical protein